MEITILPSNIFTKKINIRKKGLSINARITIPSDIVRCHDIKDGDRIVLAFISKNDEDIKN